MANTRIRCLCMVSCTGAAKHIAEQTTTSWQIGQVALTESCHCLVQSATYLSGNQEENNHHFKKIRIVPRIGEIREYITHFGVSML
jgi:hypothetical protein